MTPERLIAQHIEEEIEWLDELIAEHLREFENHPKHHDAEEILYWRRRLEVWRVDRIDILKAKLLAEIHRLN